MTFGIPMQWAASTGVIVDLAGIAAGSLRYPLWRFLLFCWMGKTIKSILIAWAGSQSIKAIEPFLRCRRLELGPVIGLDRRIAGGWLRHFEC